MNDLSVSVFRVRVCDGIWGRQNLRKMADVFLAWSLPVCNVSDSLWWPPATDPNTNTQLSLAIKSMSQMLAPILNNTGSQGLSKQRNSTNVVSMLSQRRRRWSNIETTLGECVLFARVNIRQHVFHKILESTTKP